MRTAIGRMAGPLRPPTMFDRFGRRVSTSMAIARKVLTSDTASAPASSAALAMDATSVTFGVSFGMTGRCVTFFTAPTTSTVPCRLQPKVMPPSLMFGQEMFSSRACTPSASERMRASSTYSSSVLPQMLTTLVAPSRPQLGELLVDVAVDADALQPDRVQHAGRRLDDALRRVPFARLEEEPLRHDGAERGQVDGVGVLDAVAEAAARRHERVHQPQGADRDGEIHLRCQSCPSRIIVCTGHLNPRRCPRRRTPARRCTNGRSAVRRGGRGSG